MYEILPETKNKWDVQNVTPETKNKWDVQNVTVCRNTTKDKRVRFDEVPRVENGIIPLDRRAPIKMVSGRAWSPGIYQSLRLLGKSLDVAWERAFICPLTFN